MGKPGTEIRAHMIFNHLGTKEHLFYAGVLPLYDRQLFGLRWHCRVRGMFGV